ncbi:MAG: ribonuclease H [Bacteroidaceae bacterium]|nr:ribonuclease H [Bacteroidaceae bacterium]
MTPDTYYVWCGGSCDYGHEERCSGGAYIMQRNDERLDTYVILDDHTTEFRMILSVMIHAMDVIHEGADIVFLTNVSYIQQNYDKVPTDKSANADLINECIALKAKHNSVTVKIVPFHKYPLLPATHQLAHDAMTNRRKGN